MKLLFLGLIYRRTDEEVILSKSKQGLQGSANTFQWNMIDGLEHNLEKPIQILNALPVGTYPNNYKQFIFTSKAWSHTKGAKDKEIGCINLPILKQLIRSFLFYREVKRWCKINAEDDLFIIGYSLYLPFLRALVRISKKYRHVGTCIIVPDLPNEYGFVIQETGLKKVVRKLLGKNQLKLAKKIDTFVLLTKGMTNPLGIIEKPYVIVEGICTTQMLQTQNDHKNNHKNDHKIILYYGTLNQEFGLDQLIHAFQMIVQENYELWICGVGDYQSDIEEAARVDTRIKYYGYISKSKIIELQQQATILINPRSEEGVYTKYSFPSKTLEYMTSKKPVLMFRLAGVPKEYDDYLYYIKENTIESIKQAIVDLCERSKEELDAKGKAAYQFVLQNKNGAIQTKKVLDMLKGTVLKRKKKILQINITSQFGSTGRLVAEIHQHLIDQGFCSYIVYSAFQSDLEGAFKIETTFENYLRRALNRFFGKKHGHSTFGTLRLIKNIKRIKPEVIHLHNIHQNSVHYPMLMKFLSNYGVPVVYTLHDCWGFTGGCYHFTELGCDGYKTGCIHCKLEKKQRDISNKTTEILYNEKKKALHAFNNLQVICVSDWLLTCASQSMLQDLALKVIYNGIDTNKFKPVLSDRREKLGITDTEFMILGVANYWDNKKGLNIFLKLAQLLDHPYRIVLVGMLPKDCPDNIVTIQRTDNIQDLVELYSCADVLVNASKEESFGLVAAEAMACGTPVIAYNSTACGEILDDNTGIILNSFEIETLLVALKDVRENGKKMYTTHCIDNIKRRFSKEEMLKNYLNVYEQMMIEAEQNKGVW